MRRPKLALSLCLSLAAIGLSAWIALAQQSPAPPPGASVPASNSITTSASASANSIDPAMAGRPTRYLLRNGLDYLAYREYARAMTFFRAVEARQAELTPDDFQALKKGIADAQRGMREAVNAPKGVALAKGRATVQPGAFALARSAPTDPPVQRTAATAEEPAADPVTTPPPALSPVPVMVPVPEPANDGAPVFGVRATPRPAIEPVPVEAPAPDPTPAPALPTYDPAPAPAPVIAVPEIPAAADSGPVFGSTPRPPDPTPLPDPAPSTLPTLPDSTPAPIPLPIPTADPLAAPARAQLPSPIELPPTLPAPGPADPAPSPTPGSVPEPAPAPILDPTAPSAPVVELPPTLPTIDPAPATVDAVPSLPGPVEPIPASAVPPMIAQVPASADPSGLAPASADPSGLAPASPPTAPAVEPPPAPEASSLPTLPGSRISGIPDTIPDSILSPRLREEVERIAQRSGGGGSDRIPGTLPSDAGDPNAPPMPSQTSTRLIIPRAPSPTEGRPLRRVPVPEDFKTLGDRKWEANRKYWAAAGTCHMILYFQDPVLERYGQGVEQALGPWGRYFSYPLDDPRQSNQRNQILQPFWSMGKFCFQVGTLPYKLVVDPPWEAEYDLGYYRPGDRIPPDTILITPYGIGPPLKGARY